MTAALGSSTPDIPLLHTWYTQDSGQYARLYPTLADMNSGTSITTWSRGTGTQTSPSYAGVHQIDYSSDWVYVHTTGLPSHIMGPWNLNAAKTNLFPNYPSNTASTFRFPRLPSIPATKTLFGGGNGTTDVQGAGNWNRDAWVNEGVTFDNAGAHQAGNNHHYHANPIALRYLLGDHVDYTPATNRYTESTAPVTKHSPIVGWVRDGLPIYGPYGYSDPLDAGSGVRRMVSGFALRNGQKNKKNTDNLSSTGRTTLPQWAVRAYNVNAAQAGPPVNATYPLGRYLEDNAYPGDLGYTPGTDFDLNEYNVRYGVTPEFPGGTWAYFLCIAEVGTPVFPYQVGRSYYGDPAGGDITAGVTESVRTTFIGGPFAPDESDGLTIGGGDVIVTWSGAEGGRYTVEASEDLSTWSAIATNITPAGGDTAAYRETGGAAPTRTRRFYQIARTGMADYDRTGFPGTTASNPPTIGGGPNTVTPDSGSRGTAVTAVIELALPLPPANIPAFAVTVSGTGVTVSNVTRVSETIVRATFTITAGAATGARNVSVQFNSAAGVVRTLNGAFTVN